MKDYMVYFLDYYDKEIIKMIMEKYDFLEKEDFSLQKHIKC